MIRAINLKKLLTSLVIPLGVGFFAWLFTKDSMDIYMQINTPPLTPPSALFPVVWIILYVLMGISLYIVRVARCEADCESTKRKGYALFGVQLLFNFFWTIAFFNLSAFLFSAIWLGIMIVLIILNAVCFGKINKWSGLLFVPYIIWCLFALYLNIGIYVLN